MPSYVHATIDFTSVNALLLGDLFGGPVPAVFSAYTIIEFKNLTLVRGQSLKPIMDEPFLFAADRARKRRLLVNRLFLRSDLFVRQRFIRIVEYLSDIFKILFARSESLLKFCGSGFSF